MNKFNQMLLASAALAAVAFSHTSAHAAPDPRAWGEKWQTQGVPANDQSQVIYYRNGDSTGNDAAMVYIDGEFQAALLPGMFTRFCVAPGSHSMGAYINDAPSYKGKTDQAFRATFKAGKTYYVRVNDQHNGRPQPVRSAEAQAELAETRLQKHSLSRATAVVACHYNSQPVVAQGNTAN